MKRRDDLVEMFASFLQFRESSTVWISQTKLRHSMEKQLKNHAAFPIEGNFWALYWHQVWCKETECKAKKHLDAYLQETAYQAAELEAKKVNFAQKWDKIQEYFQIGFQNQVCDRILKRFNSRYNAQLAAFALLLFRNNIKEELRKNNKVASHSDWSLLRHSSIKLWEKALQAHGLSPKNIESYLLLRDCYKSLYATLTAKANQKLSAPDTKTLGDITHLYNQERWNQLSHPGQELSTKDIQKKLEETALAIRNYQNPSEISLNIPLGEEGEELQDILFSQENESILDDLVIQQEQSTIIKLQQEINSLLIKSLTEKLKPEQKQCLQLFYGKGLTQTEIAEQLLKDKKKQYKISRQLQSASNKLHKVLVVWGKKQKPHNFDSHNIINIMDIFLKEWLQQYYANSHD